VRKGVGGGGVHASNQLKKVPGSKKAQNEAGLAKQAKYQRCERKVCPKGLTTWCAKGGGLKKKWGAKMPTSPTGRQIPGVKKTGKGSWTPLGTRKKGRMTPSPAEKRNRKPSRRVKKKEKCVGLCKKNLQKKRETMKTILGGGKWGPARPTMTGGQVACKNRKGKQPVKVKKKKKRRGSSSLPKRRSSSQTAKLKNPAPVETESQKVPQSSRKERRG